MARTLKDDSGNEVCLFPLDILHMTQDIGGGYSHAGTYAMDLVGTKQYHDPVYASVEVKLVFVENIASGGNIRVWESVEKVVTPSGLDYMHYMVLHDENPPFGALNVEVKQGNIIGHSGIAGPPSMTGDHSHIETALGKYSGGYPLIQNSYGNWMLKNSTEPYKVFFINDTPVINGFGHDWKTFEGGVTPPIDEDRRKGIIPLIVSNALYGY